MDRLETCCLCEVTEWWNDRELTIWHVNDEHLPVHLECWINGYFAVCDAARSFDRRVPDRVKGARGGDGHMAQDVSDVVLAKIKRGALPMPLDPSGKSYAGPGMGKSCDGCDELILAEDVEHEVDVTENRTLRFHQACFTIWQAAVAKT